MNFDAMAESFYSSNDPQFYVDHETEEEKEERRSNLLDLMADDIVIWKEPALSLYLDFKKDFPITWEEFMQEMKDREAL